MSGREEISFYSAFKPVLTGRSHIEVCKAAGVDWPRRMLSEKIADAPTSESLVYTLWAIEQVVVLTEG